MKRYAFGLLVAALLVQVGWMIGDSLVWHAPGGKLLYDLVLVALFAAFAASFGRWRWLNVVVRVAVALAFLLSVADRFGLFGAPGAPGVGWGDWAHFVAYTRQVNGFLPASFAPVLAVLATIAEITLGGALLLGVRIPLAALGAAALTLIYAVAMTISLPVAAQFQYAVLVFSTGSLALATVDASLLGLERLVALRAPREGSPKPARRSS